MNNPTPGPIKASPADAERIIQLTAEVDERIAQAEAAVGDPDLVAQLQAERDERIGELASIVGPALGILIPEELRRYFRKPSPPPVIDAIEIICPPATNTPCACYVHYDNGDVWFYPDCSVDINAIPFQP